MKAEVHAVFYNLCVLREACLLSLSLCGHVRHLYAAALPPPCKIGDWVGESYHVVLQDLATTLVLDVTCVLCLWREDEADDAGFLVADLKRKRRGGPAYGLFEDLSRAWQAQYEDEYAAVILKSWAPVCAAVSSMLEACDWHSTSVCLDKEFAHVESTVVSTGVAEQPLRKLRRTGVRDGSPKQAKQQVPEASAVTIGNGERKLPQLGAHDREAYQLWTLHGWKQQAIADELNKRHGTTYGQGQISRMIARAKRHAEASGLAEHIPDPAKPAKAIDPSRLEIGRRTDHRTRSQRSKRDPRDE
jgi:hypothetical protein